MGFTLIEILIVIVILVSLSTLVLGSSVKSTLEKGRDSKRKQDLNKLARYFEDYYNDQNAYPRANESTGEIENAPWGGPFASYGSNLPQDPLSPSRQYYYQTDPNSQNMFIVYARLEYESDNDIAKTGCDGGCGPARAYNYAVHSPNVIIQDGQPVYEGSVLGESVKSTNCEHRQCGVCTGCGGPGGQQCGPLARCLYDGARWLCRFDLLCML